MPKNLKKQLTKTKSEIRNNNNFSIIIQLHKQGINLYTIIV